MRKESEKKTVTKTIKMTPEQAEKASAQANIMGMSFSGYAVDCIEHRDNPLTPEIMVRVQEVVNCLDRLIFKNKSNTRDYHNAKKEINKLWELLKVSVK